MNTALTWYKKFLDKLNTLYLIIAMAGLVALVMCTALQVASRYVTFFKVLGMEELARLGFVWMVSIALSICVSNGSHLNIDLISSRFSGKGKLIYDILLDCLILIYLVVLFDFSVQKCIQTATQTTIIFMIQMKYLYSALILGSFGAMLNTIYRILNNISGLKGSKDQGLEVTE